VDYYAVQRKLMVQTYVVNCIANGVCPVMFANGQLGLVTLIPGLD